MARVNIDILGNSELKWMGMGECNSDDHYIYYCGQESLRRNGCSLKNHRMISVCFKGKPFNTTVIQVYAPTTNAKEAEAEWFYEDLQDLLILISKNDVLFITETGMQKSPQGTGMQMQDIPGVTGKFGLGVHSGAGKG